MDSAGSAAALQVSDDGLHAQAARWELAADALAGNRAPPGVVTPWSASAAAVNAAHAEVTAASVRCTSRTQAMAAKLVAAATGYSENEQSSTAQLRALSTPTAC
jgi:hypothetical protein